MEVIGARGNTEAEQPGGGEKGSAYLLLLCVALIISVSYFAMYGNVRLELRATADFQQRTTAYYGAEAGVRVALAALRAGDSAPACWEGRVGRAVYRSELSFEGKRYRIASRGYNLPQLSGDLGEALVELAEGGRNKSVIKLEGDLQWEGFTVSKWEVYP